MLRAHIESLEKLSPMKIQEYFDSVTAQLGNYIDMLKDQLSEAKVEAKKREDKIQQQRARGDSRRVEQDEALAEKEELEERIAKLETRLGEAEELSDSEEVGTIRIPTITSGVYQALVESSSEVQESMRGAFAHPLYIPPDILSGWFGSYQVPDSSHAEEEKKEEDGVEENEASD